MARPSIIADDKIIFVFPVYWTYHFLGNQTFKIYVRQISLALWGIDSFNYFPTRSPRKTVTWSPRDLASTSPSWCPFSSPRRSALISPRRSAHDPEPTQGRSRSPLSRSGATCPPRSPAWLKFNINPSNNNTNNNNYNKVTLSVAWPGLHCQRDVDISLPS